MSSFERCIREVTDAVGRELTSDEATRLGKQFAKLVDKLKVEKHAEAFDTLLMKELAKESDRATAEALNAKRNAIQNQVAMMTKADRIWSGWRDDTQEGLMAELGGSITGREGSKGHSTLGLQTSLSGQYVSVLMRDVDRLPDGRAVFKDSDFQESIHAAVFALDQTTPDAKALAAITPTVQGIARAIIKANAFAVEMANRAGAMIQSTPGYVMRRTHDAEKIAAAGREAWTSRMVNTLDWDKTMPNVTASERLGVLNELYTQHAAGTHVTFGDGESMGMPGRQNIGKGMSHERVYHFKTVAEDYAYSRDFGSGTVKEGVVHGLEKMARDTALMREWGPTARANYAAVVDDIRQRLTKANDPQLETFTKAAAYHERVTWPMLDGTLYAPERKLFARYASLARNVMRWSDLGGATVSSFGDLPIQAVAHRQQGVSMLQGIGTALEALTHGVSTGERAQFLSEFGILLDSILDMGGGRFDLGDTTVGHVTKTNNLYFNLSLLRPFSDRLRGGFVLATGHRLANHSHLDFAGLPPALQHLLKQYNLDADAWSVIRQAKESHYDGKAFLTAEGIDTVPDSAFGGYLHRQDRPSTPYQIEKARLDLKSRLAHFYQDQSTTAQVESNDMTKAMLLGGSRPGTLAGEGKRFFWMYKNFSAAITRQVLGREVFGYGSTSGRTSDAIVEMFKNPFGSEATGGRSQLGGVANLMAWATIFGYASYVAGEYSKGRKPAPMETVADYEHALAQAMLKGGGLGIYGDFLLGEMKSRFGSGPLETLMGPAWSRAETVTKLIAGIRDENDPSSPLKLGISQVMSSLPFANLFYTKWALDYLFVYRIQEMMNPGYLIRMEERAKKNKREFIYPPSQSIPYGG